MTQPRLFLLYLRACVRACVPACLLYLSLSSLAPARPCCRTHIRTYITSTPSSERCRVLGTSGQGQQERKNVQVHRRQGRVGGELMMRRRESKC
ncbi:hypothetical protein BKA80DRAFT_277925 [Phyllosticta citrichinensis]